MGVLKSPGFFVSKRVGTLQYVPAVVEHYEFNSVNCLYFAPEYFIVVNFDLETCSGKVSCSCLWHCPVFYALIYQTSCCDLLILALCDILALE